MNYCHSKPWLDDRVKYALLNYCLQKPGIETNRDSVAGKIKPAWDSICFITIVRLQYYLIVTYKRCSTVLNVILCQKISKANTQHRGYTYIRMILVWLEYGNQYPHDTSYVHTLIEVKRPSPVGGAIEQLAKDHAFRFLLNVMMLTVL